MWAYVSSSLMTSLESIILIFLIERYTERDSLCVVCVREKELYQLVCVCQFVYNSVAIDELGVLDI